VREHVVELTGDPVPLVLDGSPRLLFRAPRPLFCLAGLLRVPGRGGREDEDADEREAQPDQLRPRHPGSAEKDRPAGNEDRSECRERQPPVEERACRPAREQERQEHRVRVVGGVRIEQREDEGARGDDERCDERSAAAKEQRSGGDQGDRSHAAAVVVDIRPDVDLGEDHAGKGDRFEHVLPRPRQGFECHVETVLDRRRKGIVRTDDAEIVLPDDPQSRARPMPQARRRPSL
jgi:hypothetical protein